MDPITAREESYWSAPRTSPIKDMKPGQTHYEAVTWMRSMGISGYTDGTFRPDRPITRGETDKLVETVFND